MEDNNQELKSSEVKSPKAKSWIIIFLVVIIIALGVGGYWAVARKSDKNKNNNTTNTVSENRTNSGSGTGQGDGTGGGNGTDSGGGRSNSSSSSDVSWFMTSDGNFQASGTAPDCPSPLVLSAPTDLSKVVSILYPGQTRGGNYKPHGGFRFTDGDNQVAVTVPMDASVVDGGRYLVDGEIQYSFDFINSCGIKYRLGHLRTLSPTFAKIAEKFPEAKEMDSRTTNVDPPVKVKAGDIIATEVGLLSADNAFFDFGVYDLRQKNEASKNASFLAAHADDPDQAQHGVCWFDLLSAENEAKVRNLPATSPGSESDYCK